MPEVGGPGASTPGAEFTANPYSAIFISYASQDGVVAEAVCKALEDAGLACWIAPRDVRAGDFYADAIVQAINSCQVLVLVLSSSAIDSPHVLREVERASAKKRPIISIHIDSTALPPGLEYFLSASHWLDASQGPLSRIIPALIESVRSHHAGASHRAAVGVAAPEPAPTPGPPASAPRSDGPATWTRAALAVMVALMAAGLLYLLADKLWISKRGLPAAAASASPVTTPAAAPAAFSPPAHSVAVLPFVNMSGDPKEDYFSDGLSEELLNSLAAVRGLQVAARTSAFSFKGKQVDVAEIGQKLNVGAVLEGSVRKEGEHVRITAQLINAVTGFHLWSKTYDRDLKGVLKLQTEVATEVSAALKTTLLAAADAPTDSGGTENPQAFDAFLRGEKGKRLPLDKDNDLARIAAYSEAIGLDARFAKAYVGKADALGDLANYVPAAEVRNTLEAGLAAAERAAQLAPDLGEAHASLAGALTQRFEFARAASEFERALALAPGSAEVLRSSARFLSGIGRAEQALASARRAVILDPLNPSTHRTLGHVFDDARRFPEAIAEYAQAFSLSGNDTSDLALRGFSYLALGQYEAARKDCATPPIDWPGRTCLAIAYAKLHRQAEATAAREALIAEFGDTVAYQNVQIYSQWGDLPKALDWLDTGYRIQDPGLTGLKVDSLIDPVRREPRFQELMRKMKFPD